MNQKVLDIVKNYQGKPIRIMEVCGTHTHEIFRLGIRNILPENIHLISGPGCPVCVTPIDYIDEAIYLAKQGCTICTFGDLIRVPGTTSSLAQVRAEGGKIQMVYSPLDAKEYAKNHPQEEVVFLSVGFETTTPASCFALRDAQKEGLKNYSILSANKQMEPAYYALKGSADAFLYPGHVATITGTSIYEQLKGDGISGVVAGFTANEIMTALAVIIKKLEKNEPFFMNCYPRVVTDQGSKPGRDIISQWMEPVDSEWRGLGIIKNSGLQLKEEYSFYDARKKYQIPKIEGHANPACRCGNVLKGECTPKDCSIFGKGCTPEHPIGACMVSNEGACSAFYKYAME